MSVVLILDRGYRCSCGAELDKIRLAKGVCPECGEQLTEVMFAEQYRPATTGMANPTPEATKAPAPAAEKPKPKPKPKAAAKKK